MPKTKISEFSATPANNTDIDSINIAEGCAPSGINDAIRELMAQLKDWQSGTSNDPYVVGSSGSLTLSQGTANTVPYLNGSKVVTSGTTLQFDGSNLGIGVTPSASDGTFKNLQVSGTAIFAGQAGTEAMRIGSNWYYNGGYKYQGTGTATRYDQGSGAHVWYQATSGTAGNAISFVQSLTLDSSGNLGLGVAPNAWGGSMRAIQIGTLASFHQNDAGSFYGSRNSYNSSTGYRYISTSTAQLFGPESNGGFAWYQAASGTAGNAITWTQAMTLNASNNLLIGKTTESFGTAGALHLSTGRVFLTSSGDDVLLVNRLTNDGNLIRFFQDTTEEGNISVSGTTVSYNGGHLSRWAQTTAAKDNSLVKGTVLSNLDAMNIYTDDQGNPVDNEQLNKVKVSDVEGDANVAGVFVNWSHDEDHNVDEINMAMTGDMIIRIAQGTTVQRGDLLMSAGNGTAKPQGDDIIRSKTVAKVTSNHVTCTYADGSYCVPCVLMAC
jgi:hypothetical protein